MARATRSSTQHNQQPSKPQEKPAAVSNNKSLKKQLTKKRKRPSSGVDIDDPDDDDLDEHTAKLRRANPPKYKLAADLAPTSLDARHILDVLASIDKHGLLDREFPQNTESSSKLPLHPSLRWLLTNSESCTLGILRAAIHRLEPLSSQPRQRASHVADEQRSFCNVALSLLDQTSRHLTDLGRTSIDLDEGDEGAYVERQRKYALMQHLPNGDWWSSASSGLSRRDASELAKGQAELVAILPAVPQELEDQPTLSDYLVTKKDKKEKAKSLNLLISPRRLSAGSFLDYGPYASFAPSFDSDTAEVGRDALGELYYQRLKRNAARDSYLRRISATAETESMDVDMEQPPASQRPSLSQRLSEFFQGDDMPGFAEFLNQMELEDQVTELLERNSKALENLYELQWLRLNKGGEVEEGSDEWETAQQILESLTLLASLRPRLPGEEGCSLAPAPTILHSLHSTLSRDPTIGWKGTLSDSLRSTLSDNSTVCVKVAGTTTRPAPATAETPATPTAGTATPPAYRLPYPYPPPNTPGGAGGYYPNAYLQTPGLPFPHPYPGYPPYFAYPPANGSPAQRYYASGPTGAVGSAAKPAANANGWITTPHAALPPHLRRTGGAGPGTPPVASAVGSPVPGR